MTNGRNRPVLLAFLGGVATWIGGNWDVAWHGDLGRDRFLTPPHALILAGMVVGGVAALWALGEVRGAGCSVRRRVAVRPGMAMVGASSVLLVATLAVDNWWHGQFGLDVTLWSPPHLLLIVVGWFGFVALLADYVSGRPRRAVLAPWAGALLGMSTFVLGEFDFGYPHFNLLWSPVVLAMILGLGLALARSATGMRWCGTVAGAVAVAVRLAGDGFNVAVGRSLPTPPIGLLFGGLAFDLALRAQPEGTVPRRRRLATALLAAWTVTFVVEVPWLRAAGKTWWPAAILPQALVLGAVATLFGAVLGFATGRPLGLRAGFLAPPSAPPARARPAVAWLSAVVIAVLAVATLAVPAFGRGAGADPAAQREAVYESSGARLRVVVPHASAADWVGVLGPRHDRARSWSWLEGLTPREKGTFDGTVRGDGRWMFIWYVDGDAPWGRQVQRGGSGPVLLERFRSFPTRAAGRWARPAGYAMLVVILAIGLAATRALLRSLGPHRSPGGGGQPSVTNA